MYRFLQFAVDWGRVNISNTDISTLNEKILALGGALHRPQNKKNDNTNVIKSGDVNSSSTSSSSNVQVTNHSNDKNNNTDNKQNITSKEKIRSASNNNNAQNKSEVNNTLHGYDSKPFSSLMIHYDLSVKLQKIIVHALCFFGKSLDENSARKYKDECYALYLIDRKRL